MIVSHHASARFVAWTQWFAILVAAATLVACRDSQTVSSSAEAEIFQIASLVSFETSSGNARIEIHATDALQAFDGELPSLNLFCGLPSLMNQNGVPSTRSSASLCELKVGATSSTSKTECKTQFQMQFGHSQNISIPCSRVVTNPKPSPSPSTSPTTPQRSTAPQAQPQSSPTPPPFDDEPLVPLFGPEPIVPDDEVFEP